MAWFRVDDAFYMSRKVLSIPKRWRNAAVGLWGRAGSWTSKEELDGFVPSFIPELFDDADGRLSGYLVESGLWERVDGGFRFANFTEYQATREDLERQRAYWREKKRRQRSGAGSDVHEDVPPMSPGDTHVDSAGTLVVHPIPSHPIPDTTKTSTDRSRRVEGPDDATDEGISAQEADRTHHVMGFGEVFVQDVRQALMESLDLPHVSDRAVVAVIDRVGKRAKGVPTNPTGYVMRSVQGYSHEWDQLIALTP